MTSVPSPLTIRVVLLLPLLVMEPLPPRSSPTLVTLPPFCATTPCVTPAKTFPPLSSRLPSTFAAVSPETLALSSVTVVFPPTIIP